MTQPTYPAMFNYNAYTSLEPGEPFTLNTCVTTTTNNTNNPPWANVITKTSTNFLNCTGPQIALCYYSGPSGIVPCELADDGTASCTCYVIPANNTYKVDINAISNLNVYNNTVAAATATPPGCGLDGSSCSGTTNAPVCDAILDNTLIPGAGLISAFSDYMPETYPGGFPAVGDTTTCPAATYAGCMTAPCLLTGGVDTGTGLPLAQCTCPTFTGPYQVPGLATACNANGTAGTINLVWSASYTPPNTTQPPGFVGVPGTKNCTGVSVAALATEFGGISNAAKAMGFGTVQNFKSAIQTFCGN